MRWLLLCLFACGDNAALPDALVVDAPDAAPDGPPPPPGCAWGELFDTTNDVTPEASGQTLQSSLVYCGQVDRGHVKNMLVDSDAYTFSVGSDTTIGAELVGTGLEAFTRVEFDLVDRFGDAITTSAFVGAHAVVAATLPAGTYGIAIRAFGTEPATPIAYKATVGFRAACSVTGPPAYTESAADNDVIEVRHASDPRRALTAAADVPEPTAISLAASAKLGGTSGADDATDDYRDRDTFAFTTGASVDTLTVRLDWSAPNVDLDFLLFPESSTDELGGGTRIATSAPEVTTFAVAPSTTYWLWIGAHDSSAGLPAAYDVTLCAE